MKVLFYTKENCLLCEEAYTLLELLQNKYEFEIETRDIYTNDEWLEKFQIMIPVIQAGDEIVVGNEINLERLDAMFRKIYQKTNANSKIYPQRGTPG